MLSSVANVSWHLLDRAVIEGRGDEPLLLDGDRSWTAARLLEEVAALGGVLRHLGVDGGTGVHLDLAPEHALEAVVTALATARLGGIVADDGAAVVVCSAGSTAAATGVPRLVRAADGETAAEPDLDWAVLLRAGRTDPVPCAVLEPTAAYAPGRTVGEQVALLAQHLAENPTPYDVTALRDLLAVGPLGPVGGGS